MAKGHHIRAVGGDAAKKQAESDAGLEQDGAAQELEEAIEMESELDLSSYNGEYDALDTYETAPSRFGWIAPTLAIGLIAGWSALYGWAMQDQLLAAASAAPSEWTRWIIDWSVPVLLVGVGWLLTMRHSRAEAKRFAETAAMLSEESRQLEDRLTVVNRELSLAREFLGTQSLELESLGRVASERLSTHADELQQLIKSNSAQVEAIGSASETALGNMNRLRDDLPVVATSARDVSNQVGNAGRTAQEQLDKLVAGFGRLNEFGKASETQVASLDQNVRKTIKQLEGDLNHIGKVVGARLDAVHELAAKYRSEIDESEAKALSALGERMTLLQTETKAISTKLHDAEAEAMEELQQSRQRFEADMTQTIQMIAAMDKQAGEASQTRIRELSEEAGRFDAALEVRDRKFVEEMTRRQEEFDTREAQASEVLAQRLADLDDALAERREAQLQETEKLVAQSTGMTEQLHALAKLIEDIQAQGNATRDGLTTGLGELGDKLDQKRAELTATEEKLAELTESAVRLLEIIQSGAKHSREDLPDAIGTAATALEDVEKRASELSGMMFTANNQAEGLSTYLIDTQAKIEVADNSLEALQAKLSEQSEDALSKLQGLRGGFTRLTKQSDSFATETQEKLREGLGILEQATQAAFAALEDGAREKVGAMADTLSKDAVRELERALRSETADTLSQIEDAASQASGAGREATAQLRDQLAKVNELTINLEQRIARANEQAEEQVGNDFARRMALITDSLNSNAIDIASALSNEVADTSWDAYLKGDRGIFTRRAVRLMENGEAKDVAELYQADETFKANVNRYIHDFEAMLRSMLSTRDGNALGVTILGSDMGKLYVVLAQAIERFRQ